MNIATADKTIDATSLPPAQRHPAIFKAWTDLEPGAALLLVNDHDPVPLYYQFACENAGSFHWEYLEQGPDRWQVRISKGTFPDPGFVPAAKKTAKPVGPTGDTSQPKIIDTRPIFACGQTPCQAIDDGVAGLAPGQSLVLLVPFEPIPLYTKLGKQGFNYRSKQLPDGTWRAEFQR